MNLPEYFQRINDNDDAPQYYIKGRALTDEEIMNLNGFGIAYTCTPDMDFNFNRLGTIVTIWPGKTQLEAGCSYIIQGQTTGIKWSRKR